jgi:3-oxoadipate enol-lactonase
MQALLNGLGTYYVDTGNPGALPVVLVHGLAFDHQTWQPQIDLLKQHYRVIAYDLRGHGRTGAGDGQYTHKQYVDDLMALLAYLKIDRAVLCGLSMGGAILLRTYELFPEHVQALILCDARSEADTNEAKYSREKNIQAIKGEGLRPFVEQFLKTVFTTSSFTTHSEAIELVRRIMLNASPLGVCGALLAQAARTDTTPILSKIKVPTLIMVGEEDRVTPPSISRAMHEKIPNSELRIIPKAGHIANLENADEFNRYLLQFLGKISI